MNFSKTLLAAFAATLLVASIVPTAAATSQTWYLNNDGDLVANKGLSVPDDSPTSVNNGQSHEWWANEVAIVDVPFPAGDFAWKLVFSQACLGTWHVKIGYGDADVPSSFVSAASSVGQLDCPTGPAGTTGVITTAGFTVPQGKTLAFQIVNTWDANGGTARTMHVKTEGSSYFMSPGGDPGYPTPELSSMLLAGAGLGVIGLAVMNRK